jgi:hypothetical protein
MYNLKAMFKKKAESPVGETVIPAVGTVELDGDYWRVANDSIIMTAVSNPVTIMRWQDATPVRKFDDSYITYTFNVEKSDANENKAIEYGKYSIVKFRTKDDVHVLADVTLTLNKELELVAKTDRAVYILGGPHFDDGFDYEEAELARIAWEAEEAKKRETERHLAELIFNLLDDYADKDEEFKVDDKWGLSCVKVRGVFDFIEIGKVLNSANDEIDDLDFIAMFAESFAASQSNKNVKLVDAEYIWSVDVYGGEYDLVKVARDVIDYIANNKDFEGGVDE